jgi:hypothetical protein
MYPAPVTRFHRAFAVAFALAAAAAACSIPPAAPGTRPARTAKSAAPLSPSRSAAAAPAPAPPRPTAKALAERVADAYDRRARGEAAAARAAFDDLVKVLVSLGEPKAPGLGGADGDVVTGRTSAGFSVQTGGARGTWFFDVETGEPFAFAPAMVLKRSVPPLDASYFVTLEQGERLDLFDPTQKRSVSLPGALLAVHPDGHRAYVLGEDCRIREVGLEKGEITRTLSAPAPKRAAPEEGSRPECDATHFRDAAITADGKWLSTRFGRWSLATGAHRPLPFRAGSDDYLPAVSPDGRYVARVETRPGPPAGDGIPAAVLRLFDLDTGTVKATSKTMSSLSNADPLSFRSDPPRVCVFDYGFEAFHVPSLRAFEPGDPALVPDEGPLNFGPQSCETKFVRPPPLHPDLAARLASRVCSVGGFLVPVAHCAESP